ncbi:MAG: 30S ribosomal protein S8 [Candidatus Altiarchaeota archaeon]|nr:30S ribosomal protein S8 [Candidatus Altiarchaeota archaeon]
MNQDTLNNAISMLKEYERAGKSECLVTPNSKLMRTVLQVFQKEGYIGEFEISDSTRGGNIRIRMIKRINDCGVIKPRYPVKQDEFTLWEKRYLPSRGFGVLVVSTPKGVMSHTEAKELGIGGRLIAYVY